MGCTAFLFKILITEFLVLPGHWVHSLEYSDLLVPIFSLSYCSIGIGLIMMSIQQCTIWRRAHHLNIFELLDNHFQSGKGIKMPTIWDIVFNKSEIEFRIFRDIFYEVTALCSVLMPMVRACEWKLSCQEVLGQYWPMSE